MENLPNQAGEGQSVNTASSTLSEQPSFEDHMAEIAPDDSVEMSKAMDSARADLTERDIDRINRAQMAMPTLMQGYEAEMDPMTHPAKKEVVKQVTEKLSHGGRLTTADMLSVVNWQGLSSEVLENADAFISMTGANEGSDFDVRMSSWIYDQNGNMVETPTVVSFKNKEGNPMEISFFEHRHYDRSSGQMVLDRGHKDIYSVAAYEVDERGGVKIDTVKSFGEYGIASNKPGERFIPFDKVVGNTQQ